MSIKEGFLKAKKYKKTSDDQYQLQSQWTSSNTVEMDDGTTLEENCEKWDDKYTKEEIDMKLSTLKIPIDPEEEPTEAGSIWISTSEG